MSELWDAEEAVKRAQQGEEAAFVQLVKQYERLVFYIAIQKVGNEADALDIVQETFLEVRQSIKHLKEPKYFKAWLNRIVCSKISRHYEKRRDRTMSSCELQELQKVQEYRSYMDPQKVHKEQTNRALLDACIQQLKPIYQEALVLQYFKGYSLQEIAHILQIPEGTVKSRINVAKKELRKLIEQMEEQEQIKLDFQSMGLDALFTSIIAKQALDVQSSQGTWYAKARKVMHQFHMHPVLAPVFSGIIITGSVAGVVGAYQLYEQYHTPIEEPAKMIVREDLDDHRPFPDIMYHGKQVRSAKEAYSYVYLANVEQKQDDELTQLVQKLQAYGGAYASMASYLSTSTAFKE